MEDMGGTNIDRNRAYIVTGNSNTHANQPVNRSEGPSFFKHFIDELRDQIRGGPPRR